MKKVLFKGDVVMICEASAYGRKAYIRIEESDKKTYACDPAGNIYSIDKETGQVHIMNPEVKDEQHKNPTIRIGGKMYRIMDLIASVAFNGLRFENSQIGHLDGNPMNNAFWNLYINLRPKADRKVVERPKEK